VILYEFNQNLKVFTNIHEGSKYKISRKSVQWKPSCSVWTVRQT